LARSSPTCTTWYCLFSSSLHLNKISLSSLQTAAEGEDTRTKLSPCNNHARNGVADPGSKIWGLFDPWIRDPGSGIGFFWIPDYGLQTHIFESLVTIFEVKSTKILSELQNIFS
jgi:hypothetical protein